MISGVAIFYQNVYSSGQIYSCQTHPAATGLGTRWRVRSIKHRIALVFPRVQSENAPEVHPPLEGGQATSEADKLTPPSAIHDTATAIWKKPEMYKKMKEAQSVWLAPEKLNNY